MKILFRKSTKYAFSVIPFILLALFFIPKPAKNGGLSLSEKLPVPKENFIPNKENYVPFDLPCGYTSRGRQASEKPTFVTNNYIPILQYPAGNFPGTTTQVFSTIYSDHQNEVLELQLDGNLVLYCLSCTPKKALWSSQTNGKDGKSLFFQADGDLVLKNTQGKVIWHSNIHSTCPGSERAYFTLQDDGNMAMLYDDATSGVTYYLGGTGSTNDQTKPPHPGKIQ